MRAVRLAYLRHRAALALAGCAAIASSLLSCALFVGSPDGYTLFEAGVRVDAPACRVEEAGHDATRPSKDAGADVKKPPHPDARLDAIDSPTRDVHAPIDGGHDAPSRGFCASLVPPPNALYQCDDFDEVADATVLGAPSLSPGSSLVVEDAVALSPPNALRATDDSPDGGSVVASLVRAIAVGTTITIECDVFVATLPPTSDSDEILASFTLDKPGHLAGAYVYVNTKADGGIAAVGVKEADPIDGGDTYPSHPAHAIEVSGWTHMIFSITGQGGSYYDTLVFGGTTIEASYPLASSWFESSPVAAIGVQQYSGKGERIVYYDNVVLMSQE
jgi:hypothetical protein